MFWNNYLMLNLFFFQTIDWSKKFRSLNPVTTWQLQRAVCCFEGHLQYRKIWPCSFQVCKVNLIPEKWRHMRKTGKRKTGAGGEEPERATSGKEALQKIVIKKILNASIPVGMLPVGRGFDDLDPSEDKLLLSLPSPSFSFPFPFINLITWDIMMPSTKTMMTTMSSTITITITTTIHRPDHLVQTMSSWERSQLCQRNKCHGNRKIVEAS